MLKARDVMVPELRVVKDNEFLEVAARRMLFEGVGSLVVVSSSEEPIGIITKSDIIRAVVIEKMNPAETPVREVMSKPLKFVDANEDLDVVINMMIEQNISHILVKEDGKFVGIISGLDIMYVTNTLIDIIREKL
ncbi:MAG: CBS domain-containing protein [Desulfurococcaceae archaeon]|nr:CBS domain-containing protein [Sulfolobales archaeon]MDW8170695.1 CBS domain-containing protein [Desulfurococcaceae archaeon]